MRIADAIIKTLSLNEVNYVFGIPSATFAGILDALNDSDIEFIITKNEAGATYCATKYSDLSNKLGVCMLAGGVGVNNAINGIADAQRNKLPMLVINGDIKRSFMGKGALQEFDNIKLLSSLTKYSKNILNEDEVIEEIEKAITIAMTPPCGPVALSIPFDIQNNEFKGILPTNKIVIEAMQFDEKSLKEAINEINNTQKGLILVGRGSRGISKEIKALSEKLKWPVMSTPNGKGIVHTDFPYYIGNYGFCSADGAVEYVEKEQFGCLLILGSSLGQAATRDYNDILVKDRKVIRIDWDVAEFNKVFKEDISVCCDLKQAVTLISNNVSVKENPFIKPLMNKPYVKNHTGMSLRLFTEKISDLLPADTCFVSDMGDFFNCLFKYMPIKETMDFQTSINYACMGTGVGGVVGSYLANPDRTYAVMVGDGGFYMNGMEILTAKEYNIPIIYFVVNNSMLGLVNNGLNVLYGRSCKGKVKFAKKSIASIADAMGVEAIQITSNEEVDNIKDLLHNRTQPLLIELVTDGSEIVIDTDRLQKVKSSPAESCADSRR
ncbi:thiamine pyrophosphate-binding protein [Clostridium sp. CF011]|uniref:thiamine pyrophosphate-binding protein n=1 Tax=Clostridium sp. CF011 TaxID=2843318 RepID=UPI001C0BE9C2|nr:thiamine pyrophosphate-binding protein [Clostridium sp. CF011]MBU3092108.1 thiamine pyrophosphate-binding protein [Clostridium sp. CF011]WAG71049.1 thiamine pyrophosphate-binding protein [Clostridium sp. CF011]